MTKNQANQLAKSPNTKKALLALVKVARLEAQLKAATAEAKDAAEEIKQAMIDNNVTKIEVDNEQLQGYITLATRTTYSVAEDATVPKKFLKTVLDTKKVSAHMDLTGSLPAGVEGKSTQYITKKLTEVQ